MPGHWPDYEIGDFVQIGEGKIPWRVLDVVWNGRVFVYHLVCMGGIFVGRVRRVNENKVKLYQTRS